MLKNWKNKKNKKIVSNTPDFFLDSYINVLMPRITFRYFWESWSPPDLVYFLNRFPRWQRHYARIQQNRALRLRGIAPCDLVSRSTKSRREFDCTTLALALMRASLRSNKGHRGPFGSSRHDRAHSIKALSIFSHGFVYIPHLYHRPLVCFTSPRHAFHYVYTRREIVARRKLLGQFYRSSH